MTKKKTNISLVLRTCRADLTSRGGFQWPAVGGTVTAPDWDESPSCGQGLHGWLFGQGEHSASAFLEPDSKWLVVAVESNQIVMLGGKCKFKTGTVEFVGDKKAATDYIIANEPRAAAVDVIGASRQVGDNASVSVGAMGTATAGYGGTATAGYGGEIRIRFWDEKAERYRTAVGYVG